MGGCIAADAAAGGELDGVRRVKGNLRGEETKLQWSVKVNERMNGSRHSSPAALNEIHEFIHPWRQVKKKN
jgi:hypothetical protein